MWVNFKGENNDIKLLDKFPIEKEYLITKNFKEALNVFVSLCKSLGIEPILMTQTSRLYDFSLEKNIYILVQVLAIKSLGEYIKNLMKLLGDLK